MEYLRKAKKEKRVTKIGRGIWSRELKEEKVVKSEIYQLHDFVSILFIFLWYYLLGSLMGVYDDRYLDQEIEGNNFAL